MGVGFRRPGRSAVTALLGAWCVAAAVQATPPERVTIGAARVLVSDVVRSAPTEAGSVDLGPSPAVGASRLIDRASIVRALREHGVRDLPEVPEAVRVVRRSRTLSASEIERMTRERLAAEGLPRHAELTGVRSSRGLEVADGWDAVNVELPRLPRRTGPFSTTALLTFRVGTEVLGRASVQVDLSLPAASAQPDVARGGPLTLVVRQGLVEVRIGATASADADVGERLQVVLHPSGRVLRARLLDRDTALAEETP